MIFKSRRAVSQVAVLVLIGIVLILAFSFILLNLSQNAEPPINNVTMTIQTSYAAGGVWNGTIVVSESGILESVLVPTETKEFIGVINNQNLIAGTNIISVVLEDLPKGTYEMIFTFRASGANDAFSEFKTVVFA